MFLHRGDFMSSAALVSSSGCRDDDGMRKAGFAPLDVSAWSGLELGARLGGGARNPAYRARRDSEAFVVRVSGRSNEALAWEFNLLDRLDAAGVVVPRTVATDDGRHHDHGVLVQRFIDGVPPRDRHDWARVVATLHVVHETTMGWPQRPGFLAAGDLLHQTSGGDVRLDRMPDDAAQLVRASWRPVLADRKCAIHGDVGAGNILITDRYVALIDWDEARVDVAAFDFVHVPSDVSVPMSCDRRSLVTAGVAWEAATCWLAEPEYAVRRLAELRERRQSKHANQ